MIKGVGTDILQISRMADALIRTPKLPQRILTAKEYDQFLASPEATRFMAKRFAAKEAVVKALGTGIGRGVSWQHITIAKDDFGKPLVMLSEGAKTRAESLAITEVLLSYSDEKDYVVAFALAQG